MSEWPLVVHKPNTAYCGDVWLKGVVWAGIVELLLNNHENCNTTISYQCTPRNGMAHLLTMLLWASTDEMVSVRCEGQQSETTYFIPQDRNTDCTLLIDPWMVNPCCENNLRNMDKMTMRLDEPYHARLAITVGAWNG